MNSRHGKLTALAGAFAALAWAVPAFAGEKVIEEIVVWGEEREAPPGPVSAFTPDDLAGATLVTTEDLLKFEPSLVIRRRFIGDANGTVGMRGANMFQTSRSMVFADGVPLHYLLQSRWDGAPRWSMISASEIDSVQVLYGPFSAEYGGNAMGGVVLLESRIPQRREFHYDSTAFVQDFSAYGFDRALRGGRHFLSYGDKTGALSYYLSWNRLDNESQPQVFFTGAAPGTGPAASGTGGIASRSETGAPVTVFGDSGVIDSRGDTFKLKLGYDLGDWSALLNLAYEERRADAEAPNAYLRDPDGDALWSGDVAQDDAPFSMPPSRLGVSLAERRSLSGGLRLQGWLSDTVSLESNLSWFGVLHDRTRASARNPADPAYTPAGQVTDYGRTGWRTAEVKLGVEPLFADDLRLALGVRHEDYDLNLRVHDSPDWRAGALGATRSGSGGGTALDAAFAQLDWAFHERWDLSLGGRLEQWRSRGGYTLERGDGGVQREDMPARARSAFSPKFSLGFLPTDDWSLRYSVARAWRFPIVEELYSQYRAYNAVNRANPDLAPEAGLHHNLSVQRFLPNGRLTLNLFHENVEDVIEAQSATLPGGLSLRTFLPVDEVRTTGVEVVADLEDVAITGLGLRFNLAWTRAEIRRNLADPALEGKRYPRMPEWRANLLLDYRLSESVILGGGLRYASRSFGRLDNADTQTGVYGAQDDYLFVNLKADWQAREGLSLGIGVDNLFDRRAWVTHPWPGRTLFLEARLNL